MELKKYKLGEILDVTRGASLIALYGFPNWRNKNA